MKDAWCSINKIEFNLTESSPLFPSLLKDLGTLVEQLARFLGVSCDKAQLEGMVESCNQLIEQCCNSEALSICRGEWERREYMKMKWK